MSDNRFPRRYFFYGTLLAGAIPRGGFGSTPSLKAIGYKSPNEKLNLAAIGAGGQPFNDLRAAEANFENVVALADVDWDRGAQGFERRPKATKYKDYRQMLDKQGKEIDAVVIGTPDHMHATAALACMQLGKHVYVEKPLTRTAWEARFLAQAAEKYKVATQMGNQGYSHDATRVACEIFWSGEIGEVKEVHAWHGNPGWPQGMQTIPAPTAVPANLDWDLWLGGAAARPFTAGDADYKAYADKFMNGRAEFGFYLPFNWRGFPDFGSTLFGDWGVHILGPANWALNLSPESLISVECTKRETTSSITYPVKNAVTYEFGARGNLPPVTVYWSDSIQGDAYLPPGMSVEDARKIPGQGPQVGPMGRGGRAGGPGGGRAAAAPGTPGAPDAPGAPPQGRGPGGPGGRGPQGTGYNLIFVGSKGYMGTSGRGEGVGLLPGSKWADYQLPNAYLQRSPGASIGDNHGAHCRDWIRACKGGPAACSNFSIAGPYTEWLVLGAVATHYDGKLLWDNARMEFTNNKEATKWIKPIFRKGWEPKL
jgi:predicted dehydrogenase